MNTRSISIWRGAVGVVFAVNPKELSFTHIRKFKERELLSGETVVTPAAMLPTEIAFETFFPSGQSPFFTGDEPSVLAERIGAWQAAHEAVSLFMDGERCGNFYIKKFKRTVKEGDGDIYVALSLIEAPESAVTESVSRPSAVVAVYGDTLYSLARTYYGDGNRWADISKANGGIKTLTAGQTVKLP